MIEGARKRGMFPFYLLCTILASMVLEVEPSFFGETFGFEPSTEGEEGPTRTETDEDGSTTESSQRYISINTNTLGNPSPAIFSPTHLAVSEGITVVWVNNDFNAHELAQSFPTSQDFPVGQLIEPNSGLLEYKFESSGTFDYYCAIHPQMTGQIVVQ